MQVPRRTVAIPEELMEQIRDRAAISRRSISMEIVYLIERGLQSRVDVDLAELRRHQALGSLPK